MEDSPVCYLHLPIGLRLSNRREVTINVKLLAQLLKCPIPELGSIICDEDSWNAKLINNVLEHEPFCGAVCDSENYLNFHPL